MPEEHRRREGGAGGDSRSRREERDPDRRRPHSRSERERQREPSPKRSRRDEKPSSERKYSGNNDLDIDDNRERKHRRRFQDSMPVRISSAADTKVKFDSAKDGFDRKAIPDDTKRPSDTVETPRSRSHFQHDEHGSAGKDGLSYGHRANDTGRGNLKEPTGDTVDKNMVSDMPKRSGRAKAQAKEWKHDGFFELEGQALVPSKRPAFSEKKMPAEKDPIISPRLDSRNCHDQQSNEASRREEKINNMRGYKPERSFSRADDKYDKRDERYLQRNEMHRSSFQSMERHSTRETRGRERFSGPYGERRPYLQTGFPVEKWKHDLYDEGNKSPTPENEEEQIAKVEALLEL
ncbi:uncharacterized protein LOC122040912 [Zingiber officinale]|uniref:uncharacterized protein LOC122040912 n=1 Tax=Zingiber officinale TaxID=94328 RepID=UPI001C4CA03F|nr:uncharacterized protein LOC122040912 [Zingiber officinale]